MNNLKSSNKYFKFNFSILVRPHNYSSLENTKTNDKYDIINEKFLSAKRLYNSDFMISINSEVNVSDLCFIIKELMIKLSYNVYVDYIIKCPYNSTNNEINLKDIKLMTIAHLNEKVNTSYDENDKFKKERNIISAYMDVNNHKVNIISPNNNEKENNSILQIKKEVSQLNLATNDNLAEKRKIELPKNGAKKQKKFKKPSFENTNDGNNKNINNNIKEGTNIQKYIYDDDEDNNSNENSHRIDNNYLNNSYAINANSNYKDSKLNTIGKTYNDFNVNEMNQMGNTNNIGHDIEILKNYKDKQITPSTAATEKSYYNGLTNSKRVLNESELGRSISNLKYF